MKKLVNVIGVGLVAANVTACSSTNSPVAPSRVATAQAGDASDSVSTSTRPDFATGAKPGNETIVQIVLREDGEFDVLQAAVIRAGLVDALNGQRQLTVFAPTDQAFVTTLGVADEAAAIAAVNGLPIPDLTNILLYHVIEGRRNSRSVLAAPQYTTLGGATLTRAELVAAGIAATDISASNGIVHVINRVLLPAR